MSYDINILVHGNRCKQYHFNGRTYIESKDGSNYEIEIKNNSWKRILAVSSVDGLNVINGKTATENGPGYIIDAYSSHRIEGFRYSNDKVAKFEFTMKGRGDSYAASKGDQRNVGVIGVRIFSEKEKTPPPVQIQPVPYPYPVYPKPPYNPWDDYPYTPAPPWKYPIIWCGTSTGMSSGTLMYSKTEDNLGDVCDCNLTEDDTLMQEYSCDNIPIASASGPTKSINYSSLCGADLKGAIKDAKAVRATALARSKGSFDSATKWGEAKESRVIEVEFERDILVLTADIFYTSRNSLIDMGVVLSNERKVGGFPSAFPEKYAKPPKNWQA
jgi:hypothetical protein